MPGHGWRVTRDAGCAGIGGHALIGDTGVLDAQLHVLVRRGQRARGLELGDADDRGRAVTARPAAVVAIVQARRRRSPPAMSTAASTMAPTRFAHTARQRRGGLRPRGVPVLQGRSGRASDRFHAAWPSSTSTAPCSTRVRAQPSDGRGVEGHRRCGRDHRPRHRPAGGRRAGAGGRAPRPLRRRLQRPGALQLRDRSSPARALPDRAGRPRWPRSSRQHSRCAARCSRTSRSTWRRWLDLVPERPVGVVTVEDAPAAPGRLALRLGAFHPDRRAVTL